MVERMCGEWHKTEHRREALTLRSHPTAMVCPLPPQCS